MLIRKRYLSRRVVVGLVGLFLLVVLGASLGLAQEKITLTVWWWGEQESPGLEKWMEGTVRLYEKQNPNVTVNAVLQQTDTLIPAFKSAAAAGQGPDIQFFWGGIWTLEDAWLGNLTPISDYWSDEQLNHLLPGARAETFWNEKQWGVPFYPIGTAWAYNKKLFKKAGLDPENPPVTWEEYLKAGKKLRKIGVTPIGGGIKDGWLGGWLISYYGQQTLDSFQDLVNAITGKESFTEPKHAIWWSKLDELIREKMWNVDVTSLDLYQGQEIFRTGEVAMTYHVQPGLVGFEREMGSDVVGVMMTPIFGKSKLAESFGAPSQILAIPSFAKYKEVAADFLLFIHTPDRMKAMYEIGGAISPDDRFDAAWLVWEADKKIQKWTQERPEFWYQYYYPPMLESDGAVVGCQNLFTRKWTSEQAAENMDNVIEKWRKANPELIDNYGKWKPPTE